MTTSTNFAVSGNVLSATDSAAIQALVSGVGNGAALPILDAQLASSWAVYGANNGTVTNTTDTVMGQVLNINVTTVGTRHYLRRDLSLTAHNQAGLSFFVKRDANLAVLDMEITIGDYASSRRVVLNKAVALLDVGVWSLVAIPLGEYEGTSGSPTTADSNFITSVAIGATAVGGQTTTLQVAGLVGREVVGSSVSIHFDDARLDTFTFAYKEMRKYGFVGSVSPEYQRLGTTPSYALMTQANVAELYAAGWAVLGHHVTAMPTLTEAQQVAIYRACKDWMRASGFTRGEHIWVWPGGIRDTNSEMYARRYFQVLRRASSMITAGIPGVYEPLAPPNRYVGNTNTAALLLAGVDQVRMFGGNIVFTFHSIVPSVVASEDFAESEFILFCAGLAARGMTVTPVSDVWTKT